MPDDPGQLTPAAEAARLPAKIDGPFGPIPLRFPEGQSNALLVGSELSESGRPIAVMGPQVGYWSPEILMEIDLHGPGIDARGVGFPGISQYVLLGRGHRVRVERDLGRRRPGRHLRREALRPGGRGGRPRTARST